MAWKLQFTARLFPFDSQTAETTPAGRCRHSPGPQTNQIRRHFLLLTSQSRCPRWRRPKNLEIGQSFSSFTCGEKDETLKNWSGKSFGSCLSLGAYRAGRDWCRSVASENAFYWPLCTLRRSKSINSEVISTHSRRKSHFSSFERSSFLSFSRLFVQFDAILVSVVWCCCPLPGVKNFLRKILHNSSSVVIITRSTRCREKEAYNWKKSCRRKFRSGCFWKKMTWKWGEGG